MTRRCVICSRELRVPLRCTAIECAHSAEGIEYDRDMVAEIRRIAADRWGAPVAMWRERGRSGPVYHVSGRAGDWYEPTLCALRRYL